MEKKRFLFSCVLFQFIFLFVMVLMKNYEFEVPLLIQILYIINLTIIPGFIFLRIIKIDKIDVYETVLYSIGMSIFFIMLIGLFMNWLYPLIGVKPFSSTPVVLTFTGFILILSFLLNLQNDNGKKYLEFDFSLGLEYLTNYKLLFLIFMPILSILGAIVNYFYGNNIILLILLLYIVLTVFLVGFDKIPKNLYPIAVLSISISLLMHTSLSSFSYLSGADIWHEYITQLAVVTNNVWDWSDPTYVNSVLSITILGPIYYCVSGLSLDWILKIIYPLIFSLVPLTLFKAYNRFTNEKISFLAAFVFMSLQLFFFEMLQLARQEIAEFFLALLILLFVGKLRDFKIGILIVAFSFSLCVSHYGLSYIYCFYIVCSIIIIYILNVYGVKYKEDSSENSYASIFRHINLNYVLVVLVMCLGYYFFVSSGHTLAAFINIGNHVISSINLDFLSGSTNQQVLQGVGASPLRSSEFTWQLARIFQLLIQFLIVIGVIELLIELKNKKTKFNQEFSAFALVSMLILILCIVSPVLAGTLNMGRFFQITLLFLAPFSIFGGLFILRAMNYLFSKISSKNMKFFKKGSGIKILIIFILIPYFLLTTGFIFEVTGSTSSSIALSLYNDDWSFFQEPEFIGVKWLAKTKQNKSLVYTDLWGKGMLIYNGLGSQMLAYPKKWNLQINTYVFLRRWNIDHNELFVETAGPNNNTVGHVTITGLVFETFEKNHKIYDNGDSNILWHDYSRGS